MNPREKAVLVFLTLTFLVGAGIGYVRRADLAKKAALAPVRVLNPADTLGTCDSEEPGDEESLLDLNSARKYQLEGLPGIGPVLAQRIIDYRDKHGGFKTVAQLREVSGIGPKRYAALAELVTVSKPAKP